MIANLKGSHETVEYKDGSSILLYDNTDYEAYPKHWHTAIEIIMPVINTYPVDYGDGEFLLKEGDILFLCPGALHTLNASRGERFIFQVELSSVTSLSSVESFLTMLYPGTVITKDNHPESYDTIRSILLEIIDEYRQGDLFYEASIYGKVLEMLVVMRRSHASMSDTPGVTDTKQREYMDKFIDVCDFISEHCTEELSLDMAAARAGFSKYHFSRLFKQFTNVSFYKYLNQKRIDHAALMLIDPAVSVTEVALSSGFTSLSAFIRMFKLIKGCTPSEYRAMYNLP